MNLKFIGWNLVLLLFVLYLGTSIFEILAWGFSRLENGITVRYSVPVVLINIILNFFLALGVFGYAYKRKILNRLFWKLFLPASVLWGSLQAYNTIFRADELGEGLVIVVVLGTPCVLAYMALYRYVTRGNSAIFR